MSSALAAASLILKPEGYSEGRLQTLKPIDRSGDFTFTRGSNLSATRVNSAGLIEKGRENLLTQSNQFDTTWATSSPATITGGQADKDGGTSAWKLEADVASTAYVRQFINTSSSVSTFSFYAKAGTANYTFVNCVSVTAFFDLANGVVGAISGGANVVDTSITSVAGGWYRVSLTGLGMTEQRIYTAPSNDNSVSAIGDNIYIQDAQLEAGMVATDYIETGASTVKAGILETTPRLDYSGGATEPSLLLEPSRTNLIGHSEYFGDSSWIKSASTITNNTLTSPQGSNNASYLTDDTANNFHGLYTIKNVSSDFTCSIFVKYDNKQFVSFLSNNNGASDRYAYFDLINKTTHTISSGLTASVEDVGNGWLRLSVMGVSSANGYYWWNIAASNSTTAYVGDGTGRVGIYGAQLEEGSYPTSYIPTYGSSATREADFATKTGISDLIGQTQGSFFAEFKIENLENLVTRRLLTLSNGNSNTRIVIYLNSLNKISIYIVDGGVAQWDYTGTILTAGTYKIAVGYATNDFVLYVNGSLESTDSAGSVPATNRIDIGSQLGSNVGEQPIKQLSVFKTRLTNVELATLTT